MYRIITPDGTVFLTEKPNFIRMHTNSCFILTERKKAEGVAYGCTPYLFADGAQVHEIDGGDVFEKMQAKMTEQEMHLMETDEVAIQLFENSLTLEAVNAEQDEAIIEIYEAMEGIING